MNTVSGGGGGALPGANTLGRVILFSALSCRRPVEEGQGHKDGRMQGWRCGKGGQEQTM